MFAQAFRPAVHPKDFLYYVRRSPDCSFEDMMTAGMILSYYRDDNQIVCPMLPAMETFWHYIARKEPFFRNPRNLNPYLMGVEVWLLNNIPPEFTAEFVLAHHRQDKERALLLSDIVHADLRVN